MNEIQCTSPTINQRLRYFDIAKGAALLGIIIFHYIPSHDPRFQPITKIINFLPVFLLLSGYFISDRLSNIEHIKKRFKELILPYIIGGVLFIITAMLVQLAYGASFTAILANAKTIFLRVLLVSDRIGETEHIVWDFCTLTYYSPLYFLPLLFVSSVGVILSRKNNWIGITFCLLALASYYSYPYIALPFTLQSGIFCFLIVYSGYLMKKTRFLEQKSKWYVISLCTLITCVFYIYGDRADLRGLKVGGHLIGIVGVLASSYLFIIACKILDKANYVSTLLSFIGSHTLLLLIIHSISCMNLPNAFFQPFLDIVFAFVGKNSHQIVCTIFTRALFDVLIFILLITIKHVLTMRTRHLH